MSRRGADQTKFSAAQVLAALRTGPFREPAHSWLENVRNQTGYGRQPRYADALVVSLWPSRGLWIAGVEVKVDRADWKRELDDPNKSDEIQRFCDYWWVASPDGVIRPGEVPETWGWLTAPGLNGSAVVTKEAPRLTPDPLSKEFVASVLRNLAGDQENVRTAAKVAAREELRTEGEDARKKAFDADSAVRVAEREAGAAKAELQRLRDLVGEFELAAGLPAETIVGGSYRGKAIGRQFAAASVLAERDVLQLAASFQRAASALSAVGGLTGKGTS